MGKPGGADTTLKLDLFAGSSTEVEPRQWQLLYYPADRCSKYNLQLLVMHRPGYVMQDLVDRLLVISRFFGQIACDSEQGGNTHVSRHFLTDCV